MLTPVEKTVIDVISVFENGMPNQYGKMVCLQGDTGGLSGGLLMATLRSGSLGKLLRLYRNMGGTLISEEEVRQTEAKDLSQNTDPTIRKQFKAAAADPIMREAQQQFFADHYLKDAKEFCKGRGFTEPLILCVVFDGMIHGSFKKIDSMVPRTLNQWDWCRTYVATRKRWLSEHANPLLHKTVYRMEFFEQMLSGGNWKLERPLVVHGYTLN